MNNFIMTSTISPILLLLIILHSPNGAVVQARHIRTARLTLVSFATVWPDGGWATAGCGAAGEHHDGDREKVVALSSEWYDKGRMCNRYVRITGGDEGRTVTARVVGECDAALGCGGDVVDASRAVWAGLKVRSKDWGRRRLWVTWLDV